VKRLVLFLCTTLILTGCGNPSVIAYTRGMMFQREAEAAMRAEGKLNNKIESKYFQAIEQFNSAVHFDPKLADAYYRRGVCREQIKQYDAAVGDFSQVVTLQPHNPDAYLLRGIATKNLQKWPEAIADFTEAERLEPGMQRALFEGAYCKLYVGDNKGALQDAQKLIGIEKNQYYYTLLAGAYRNVGNIKEMDAAFAKAIELSPHNLENYQNRAYSNFIVGRYEPAIADCRAVLNGSGWKADDAPYAVLIGFVAAKLGKNEDAAKQFMDEAIERLQIPKEIDKNAHNARVANEWPVPILQYFHRDITRDTFVRAAQGDTGRQTEMQCYLGLDALIKGDKKLAKTHLVLVVENGRRDYVEWEAAKRFLSKL
jgi:tetratricopeptide (TPR) repeat protein